MNITKKEKGTVGDYLTIILLIVANYSLIAIKFVKYRGVKMETDDIERIKKGIQEMKEKIEKWVNNPSSKIRKINNLNRISKKDFDTITRKLVESQVKKSAGFEGGIGETEDIPYGLIKFIKPYILRPWEEGLMVIFEKGSMFNANLRMPTTGGMIIVLGFGVDTLTKELIGISFYDDSPSFAEHQLEGEGGFYFGSTEYVLPTGDMGGIGGFNKFIIPTGNEYRKYFNLAQQVWKNYAAGVYEND